MAEETYTRPAARRVLPVRVGPAGYAAVKRLADQHTNGNVSEMARMLLAEAIAARKRADTR